MNATLEKHVRSGEIRYSQTTGYHCNVCDVPLDAQPLPHLSGTQHKNKAFFIALRRPVEYRALFHDLDDAVREAVQDNIIEVHDLSIKCLSCGISLSGEKPLKDHLKSSGHLKKTDVMKLSRGMGKLSTGPSGGNAANPIPNKNEEKQQNPLVSPYVQRVEAPSENFVEFTKNQQIKVDVFPPESGARKDPYGAPQPWLGTRDQPVVRTTESAVSPAQVVERYPPALQDDSVEEKAIQSEVAAGHIEDLGGVYRCKACRKSLTGREPVLQHINGRKHRSKTQTAMQGVPTTQPEPQFQGSNDVLEDDLFGSKKHRPNRAGGSAGPTTHGEMFNYMHNPQYATNSTQASFAPLPTVPIAQMQYGSSSSIPLETQHQYAPFPGSAVAYPEPATEFRTIGLPSGHSSQFGVPFDIDVAESVPKFEVKKIGSFWHRPPTAYNLMTRPRGYVAVFNNHFDDHPDWKRDGSRMDDENLKSVFTQMEYQVDLFPNTTRSRVFEYLNQILRKIVGVDSLILFFLSHGKDERRFYSADKQLIDIRDIWIKLTDQNCPALKNKPKILFLNYCRGESKQTNRVFDNISEREEDAPKDVAIVHASLPGFKAQRMPTEGTLFVHSLCHVLCESACEKDIHEIINDTTQLMQTKGGTTPSIEFILFKKFYFID